jgi:hypothetical protein
MFHHGVPKAIRTHDLRLRRPLLYPAELWGHCPYNISQKEGVSRKIAVLFVKFFIENFGRFFGNELLEIALGRVTQLI